MNLILFVGCIWLICVEARPLNPNFIANRTFQPGSGLNTVQNIGKNAMFAKNLTPGQNIPRFMVARDEPEFGDGTMDYQYMVKNRGENVEGEEEGPTKTVETQTEATGPGTGTETETGSTAGHHTPNTTQLGENSGNVGNTTNSNNTTNNTTNNPPKSMDDMPVSSLKAQVPTNNNVQSRTDNSHHKGDTSTFVTNNFFNPANHPTNNVLSTNSQLEFEYLWKRIYDIDAKLAALSPIRPQAGPGNTKKGLIITFENEPNQLSVDS